MRRGLLLALGTLALVGFNAGAQVPQHPHHHLHHALWELRDARKELHGSKHNFGGHKQAAIKAIDAAIIQVDLVLKNTGNNTRSAPARGDLRAEYKKYKHHPHLHHAVVECKHAHRQLRESKHDFGGHREAALRDVSLAITQMELCLKHYK